MEEGGREPKREAGGEGFGRGAERGGGVWGEGECSPQVSNYLVILTYLNLSFCLE